MAQAERGGDGIGVFAGADFHVVVKSPSQVVDMGDSLLSRLAVGMDNPV